MRKGVKEESVAKGGACEEPWFLQLVPAVGSCIENIDYNIKEYLYIII